MNASVLVAGSGNITGMNVIRALSGHVDNLVGYDCCPSNQNPSNLFCVNETVPGVYDAFPRYIDIVFELVRKHQATMIIASNDHEVRALANNRAQLAEMGVTVNAMTPLTLSFLDKAETSQLFSYAGIPTPQVYDPYVPQKPYVLRKKLVGSNKKFTYLVRSKEDEAELPNFSYDDVIATELLQGDEYTVDILGYKGRPDAIVPRLRRDVKNGMVHFGEVVKDDLVIGLARKMTMELALDGIYCAQCIRNENGCFYFEINPRPGSGMDLTTAAGVNLPLMWVKQQMGITQPYAIPAWGTKMVRYYSGYYFT